MNLYSKISDTAPMSYASRASEREVDKVRRSVVRCLKVDRGWGGRGEALGGAACRRRGEPGLHIRILSQLGVVGAGTESTPQHAPEPQCPATARGSQQPCSLSRVCRRCRFSSCRFDFAPECRQLLVFCKRVLSPTLSLLVHVLHCGACHFDQRPYGSVHIAALHTRHHSPHHRGLRVRGQRTQKRGRFMNKPHPLSRGLSALARVCLGGGPL
mmetsp:Transcript_28267/g.61166  ORF Transcript_28267/g.61166 Transcript_28267/m.61166 type:complete len:213 (-) Transcript_28267:325-963(-)